MEEEWKRCISQAAAAALLAAVCIPGGATVFSNSNAGLEAGSCDGILENWPQPLGAYPLPAHLTGGGAGGNFAPGYLQPAFGGSPMMPGRSTAPVMRPTAMQPYMQPGIQPGMHPATQAAMQAAMQRAMQQGMQPAMHPGMQPSVHAMPCVMPPATPNMQMSRFDNNPYGDPSVGMMRGFAPMVNRGYGWGGAPSPGLMGSAEAYNLQLVKPEVQQAIVNHFRDRFAFEGEHTMELTLDYSHRILKCFSKAVQEHLQEGARITWDRYGALFSCRALYPMNHRLMVESFISVNLDCENPRDIDVKETRIYKDGEQQTFSLNSFLSA